MVALLKTLLGLEGCQVVTLLDKTGNIPENIRHEKPEVLLIDFFPGNRNGKDIVRQTREMTDMKELKIIMVSGTGKTEECLAAGANAFPLKPYKPEDLFDLLRS